MLNDVNTHISTQKTEGNERKNLVDLPLWEHEKTLLSRSSHSKIKWNR